MSRSILWRAAIGVVLAISLGLMVGCYGDSGGGSGSDKSKPAAPKKEGSGDKSDSSTQPRTSPADPGARLLAATDGESLEPHAGSSTEAGRSIEGTKEITLAVSGMT
jgi:hypothetical protein